MRIESLRDLHAQFPDIDGFWDFHDLARTEMNIQAVLPVDEGPWTAKSVEHLTQMARVLALLGNLPTAKKTLERAHELIMNLAPEEQIRPLIRYYLETGRIFCLSMTPAKAQGPLTQAFNLSKQINDDYLAIDAALMLSISRPPKFQNEMLLAAMELAEKSKIPQAQLWLAQLYTMDGWHYFDFRRFEDALARFEKALARPRFEGDQAKVFVIRWCIARTLRSLGRTQEALDLQQNLMNEMSLIGNVSGHVYLEIAENIQLIKGAEHAKSYFEMAYKELSADGWYSDNREEELRRIQHLYKKRY